MLKLNEKDPPSGRFLDAKVTADPGSDSTVWSVPSWLIQVTLVPALMVIADGLNAKFLMTTEFSVPVNVWGGEPVIGDDVHPAAIHERIRTTASAAQGAGFILKFISCTDQTRI